MVAFWREIRMRPRPDGLPGASQPYPTHLAQLQNQNRDNLPPVMEEVTAATPVEEVAAAKPAIASCRACEEGLPGAECFGSSMIPSKEHTLHHALRDLLLLPQGENPKQGRAGEVPGLPGLLSHFDTLLQENSGFIINDFQSKADGTMVKTHICRNPLLIR